MTTKYLTRLRCLMKDKSVLNKGEKLDAYILPSSDAHGSEYLTENDKRRGFLSGFTGSSGTAVVTDQQALLWTDGRYYLQASGQLDSNWKLMKDGLVETPSIGDWLVTNLPAKSLIGIDTTLYEENLFQTLSTILKTNECELVDTKRNLIDIVRQEFDEQPMVDLKPLIKLDSQFTGLSTGAKLKLIREYMVPLNLQSMVVSSLDDIAWLLNLRGRDIPYGTVFFAYCIVTIDSCKVFSDLKRLNEMDKKSESCCDYLLAEGDFEFFEYEEFFSYFKTYVHSEFIEKYGNESSNAGKIFLSSSSSQAIPALGPEKFAHTELSYLLKLRVIKNSGEIEGARRIHIRDSALLTEFLHKTQAYDFKQRDHFDFELNEFNLGKYLDDMRSGSLGCMSPSFETICSSGANGAIIHYKADKLTSNQIEQDNILLLDSGGHYLDMGTTDVTRTVFLGDTNKITQFQKECFTRVLKGHIQLANRVFPAKTRPECLDSFARQALWEGGLDYRHGTGHGVGALLNVHEMPIIANRKGVDIGVQENMIMTIEPGYYHEGRFGIRIENCYLVVRANTKHNFADVEFLRFEPLTLVPIQREFIEESLINNEEKTWLNYYHKRCLDEMGNKLLESNKIDVYKWLVEQTKPL